MCHIKTKIQNNSFLKVDQIFRKTKRRQGEKAKREGRRKAFGSFKEWRNDIYLLEHYI